MAVSRTAPVRATGVTDPARLRAVRRSGLLAREDPGPLLRLAEMARTLLRTPCAFLSVVDDRATHLLVRTGTLLDGDEFPIEESLCRHVVEGCGPLVVTDVRADPRTAGNPALSHRGLLAWVGFPVSGPDGHVLGVLAAADADVRQWTGGELDVLRDLAALASREVALRVALAASADAVRTAEAAAALARRAHERETLFARIGELLTAGLDLPAVWRAVVRLAVPALADYAFVHSVERDALTSRYLLHRDPARQQQAESLTLRLPRRLGDSSGPGLVARTGRPQLVPDIGLAAALLSPEQQLSVARLGSTSSISVPLRARDALIGVLTVVRVGDSPAYTEDDVVTVEAIASRAALALDNALAYHRERRASVRLQHALLPEVLPQPGHLSLASRYRPAGRRQLVGGDWYDAFVDGRGATTLVVGDVAGHDISAAAAMGQLRAMIRMAGHPGRRTPAEVLSAVDTTTEGLGTSVFATAVLARVTRAGPGHPPGSLSLIWSSAGHLPPVLVRPAGTATLLQGRPDLPLGLDLPASRARRARSDLRTVLPPGGTFVLYTDGLVERREQDLDAGTDRLLDTAAELAGLTPERFCDALLDRLAPDRSDDIAVLVLRNPAGAG